ncbi:MULTISPECIES: non-ribosomal peptide synthetase [Tsukamurella]|uniref:Amino acid adenylation domain-containing protein n=2 Tax=Tsukamurella TaxID=2060 RepID=A0A5C5RYP5_9ACTN|nr:MULTISPECIES: non-ribosomal peptide synthetase [Tsukamurella]NMD55558.1 amino acid adenylation domain-containing protein [Tsukamurella columbiensis]TWS27335.1 amino acid adenylation domain-containing protein [Tsukamurella conjunctivitidis]
MTEIADRLAALSPSQRRALLARLGRAPSTARAAPPIAARVRDGDAVRLSATQENMWFLEQFHPGTSMHVMSGVARLPIDVPHGVLTDCLEEVIERHAVLRTRFGVEDGEPVGRIAPAERPEVALLDGIDEARMWDRFGEDARTPFDVERDPLLRATLARTDSGGTWVQITLHHMVADGYSTGILFAELGRLATGRLVGRLQQLPAVPFQYADVALWERERADAGEDAGDIAYWTERLDGAPTALTLPTDRPRPARQAYRGRRTGFALSAELAAAVRTFSAEHGVTPFVTVLSAYATVLARWSAQDGVVVGVPVAQRSQPGTERVIGPFLNTLALPVELPEGETVKGLIAQVNTTVRAGFSHQDARFDRVLSALDLGRDPARPPLFQAILNMQEDRSAPEMEMRDLYNGCAKFDVLLNITTTPGSMTGTLDVAADLFDQETADALIDGFTAVLGALTAPGAPLGRPVSTLPLSSSAPAIEPPVRQPETPALDEYVLAAAHDSADRTAIVAGTERITYAELDTRVGRLAARIAQHLDAPPGTPVGLLLPRSAEVIVAMLATMRAGYSFVPLDPAYPAERLAFICTDAGIPVLITTAGDLAEVPGLDLPWIDVADAPAGPVPDPPTGDPATRTAYMLYTSGSTGRPKGVRVSHRNVVTFLEAMRAEPGMTPSDTLLAVTSPSFDIAVLELLLPLATGARVVIANGDDARDGDRLAALLDEHAVTVMQATPTTWHLLLDAGWPGTRGLRALCGGEAMPAVLAGRLLVAADELWNMYGPTETTIWSTVHRVTHADVAAGTIPIGHPIRGTGIVVTDATAAPVPHGVFGELCIIGDGVTLGYHERPDLTADRFVTLAGSEPVRAYRTGDAVRRFRDGRIEFGGRIDTQVKVRGFRVELGEIESALETAVPGVRAIAAVDAEGSAITAYLECSAEALGDAAALLGHLRETLPPYMVPSAFAVVDAFPLTPNRKIDRKALAARGGASVELSAVSGTEYIAARTDLERDLTAIWSDLLGLPTAPGVRDDFFLLGGHSLLATKLVFRIREKLGRVVPLPALFAGELTIERLAAILERGGAGFESPLVLADEVVLPDEIRPAPGAPVRSVVDPRNLFVTGATGFVGSFLLAELIRTSGATMHCLVRAGDPREGMERIRSTMRGYGIWDDSYADRIVPVVGDLTRERLGLSPSAWADLASTTDGIMHCGADVNFLRPYPTLKSANVDGTVQVLALACDGPVKPVHFVSTTYVFSRFSYPQDTIFAEDDRSPVQDPRFTFGYTQSKWVGEQLVFEARARGVPTYVYRTGRVAGHSLTGACQQSDFLWQTIRLGVALGAAPTMDMSTDITPVDYLVGAIAHLARRQELAGRTFHVVSRETVAVPDLVRWMSDFGYAGEELPFGQWCERAADMAEREGDETAAALAPFLSSTPLDNMPDATFDDANVREGLAGTGIVCPPIDGALLRRYFEWFIDSGYLPAPSSLDLSESAAS